MCYNPHMSEITQEQLDQWRALADAATPGPWFAISEFTGEGGEINGGTVVNGPYTPEHGSPTVAVCPDDDNAEFIIAAREAVAALIREVERLRIAVAGGTK